MVDALILLALQAAPLREFSEPGACIRAMTWTGGGLTLGCLTGTGQAYGVVRDPDQDRALVRLPAVDAERLAVSSSSIVLASRNAPLQVLDPGGRAGPRTLPTPSSVLWLAISPDGGRLAVADPAEVSLHALQEGPALSLEDSGRVFGAVFSPDGRWVAGLQQDRGAGVWEAKTGRRILTLEVGFWCTERLAFSPDGGFLISTDQVRVRLWRLPDGELLAERAIPASRPLVSPDGRFVLVVGHDRKVHRLALPTLDPVDVPAVSQPAVVSMALSPDGTRLATGHSTGVIRLWRMPPLGP